MTDTYPIGVCFSSDDLDQHDRILLLWYAVLDLSLDIEICGASFLFIPIRNFDDEVLVEPTTTWPARLSPS